MIMIYYIVSIKSMYSIRHTTRYPTISLLLRARIPGPLLIELSELLRLLRRSAFLSKYLRRMNFLKR